MTDRLTLARAFEEGGIKRDAAEHIATEIFDAIHENVATKADVAAARSEIAAVGSELKTEIQAVRSELKTEIQAVRSELKAEIQGVRSELKAEIQRVRSELKADVAAVRAEIALVEHRLMTPLGGAIAVAVGIILAAIRYLPHG
jgi:hypothetical protein